MRKILVGIARFILRKYNEVDFEPTKLGQIIHTQEGSFRIYSVTYDHSGIFKIEMRSIYESLRWN